MLFVNIITNYAIIKKVYIKYNSINGKVIIDEIKNIF